MPRTTRADVESRAWWTPLTVVVVAVLAVVAGAVVALAFGERADIGSASPTPSPSPTVGTPAPPDATEMPDSTAESSDSPATSSTASPTADPRPTPLVRPPDDLLPPYGVARVTGDGLRLRAEPSAGAEVVATLAAGELLGVAWGGALASGPVQADGLTWYSVLRLADLPVSPTGSYYELIDQTGAGGWVAAGEGSNRFLELVPARCVARDPDLGLLDAWTPWERLSCLGGRSITFEGVYGCGGCGGFAPGVWQPEWLASPLNFDAVSVDPDERIGPMSLRFPPDGPEPPEAGAIVRVTGHFDDPASAGCERAPGDPPEPEDPRMSELYCRVQFVVETYEIIGTFDDFPTG